MKQEIKLQITFDSAENRIEALREAFEQLCENYTTGWSANATTQKAWNACNFEYDVKSLGA